jgi:hypothetical protein
MPCERITCMWEDNTATDVTQIGAFVNTIMKLMVLWKAGYFSFRICSWSTKSPFVFSVLP